MQYNKGPSIISTLPKANSNGFPVDGHIVVTFDKDISKASIAGNVVLLDRSGTALECRYQYINREITIIPREGLRPGSTYTVIIHGDMNPNNATGNKGIISPTGSAMLGNYQFAFTTIASTMRGEEIVGLSPNGMVFDKIPELKGQTTHDTINPTQSVQIQISSSNTFESGLIIWDGDCDIKDFEQGFRPNVTIFDGTYYWRARSCSDAVNENYGEWSQPAQFAIETHVDATVVADDHVNIDVAFPEDWDMLPPAITEVYPQDNRSHVKTNLKTMSVVLDQIVPETVLEDCYITLTGKSVDEDIENESHGEIEFTPNVIYDYEAQTTTIVISLPELGGDE